MEPAISVLKDQNKDRESQVPAHVINKLIHELDPPDNSRIAIESFSTSTLMN